MGMYTEIYINVNLKKETPQSVLDVLKAMCDYNEDAQCLKDHPSRWLYLFGDCSYYTPRTECAKLTYDDISKQWSLLGKGDIKNYGGEIEEFFEWICPWIDFEEDPEEDRDPECEYQTKMFVGYHRYEEDVEPTLVYKSKGKIIYVRTNAT